MSTGVSIEDGDSGGKIHGWITGRGNADPNYETN